MQSTKTTTSRGTSRQRTITRRQLRVLKLKTHAYSAYLRLEVGR